MGPNSWFTVMGDGKGGAKLRKEASYTSAGAGEAKLGGTVRIDLATQLPNGKLRFHICEPKDQAGWASSPMVKCQTELVTLSQSSTLPS